MSTPWSIHRKPVQQLFAGGRLSEMLADLADNATGKLAAWPPDDILNTPETDVAEHLIKLATVKVPSLARDKARLEPPVEIPMEATDCGLSPRNWMQARDFRLQSQATVTCFTLVAPVAGVPYVFGLRASTFSAAELQAEIDYRNSTLRLHCHNPEDAAQAKAYFDQTLDQIEQRLTWTRADIETHNRQIAGQLQPGVAQRRSKLLRDRDLQATVGYPIMKRPDADSHRVPVKRKKITPGRQERASGRPNAYVPEPAIDKADYEAVLAVLRNARNMLERSPSIGAKLDEEEMRDILLLYLNSQFEGNATGETFNYMGKTDILVREGDRNVFIGECKIFDPSCNQSAEHVATSALDQLLNRYLAWRDTKAALILFIRDANVTDTVGKALTAMSSHPNYKRPGEIRTEERHDFVLRASGDPNREIYLAFLPFLIGTRCRSVAASRQRGKRGTDR